MKVLKGILVSLVIVFVIIMGVGAYLFGLNQNITAMPEQPVTEVPDDHSQSSGDKEKLVPVIVGREQVAPEEYLRDMEQALDLIREATGLITNEAYMTMTPLPGDLGGTDTNAQSATPQAQPSMDGMGKIHQGIYKMAQGITILDINMKGMGQEIKTAREDNVSFYEIPGQTKYKLYAPYNPYGNYYNPGYPPTPYPDQQVSPGGYSDPNQQAGHPPTTQPTQGLTSLFSVNTLVYAIYVVLILSVIAGVVGVLGFLGSFLRRPTRGSDANVG